MGQTKYIRVIGDYGDLGDMAFAEVTDRLHEQIRDAGIGDYHLNLGSVPAFDTYATGFMLAQLAINSKLGADHFFYVNTAPRKDQSSARINNEGEGLVYVRLKNGVQIVAVNSGYSLTLIKPFAEEIRQINVDKAGSQFRSRDIFPQALGAILRGDASLLGADVRHTVPDEFPKNRVVYTDGYGNLKCSVDPADIERDKGKRVHIHIESSNAQIPAMVGAGIFSVADGDFCFARGSSGWSLPNGLKMEFAEIVKRGGSAAEAFRHPSGGDRIEWRPVPR
jgi:hypothetical protein